MPLMTPLTQTKTYTTLDAIVTLTSLGIIAFIVWGLMFLRIPENNLPVLAGLATGALSLPLAYASFRWGNSVATKAAQESADKATTALAVNLGSGGGGGPTSTGTMEVTADEVNVAKS